jgi:hypothetical protein
MPLGVVAVAMLVLASGALARQTNGFVRGRVELRMLARERVAGPAWVLRNLTGSREHGDGGSQGGVRTRSRTFNCNGTFSGITVRNLVVGPSGVCLLTDSVVRGHVEVQSNGDFEAGNTSIGGNVTGDHALTVYLYDGSNVGGRLNTRGTAQVFAFNSAVGNRINVIGSSTQVFLCNNTVGHGIAVVQSASNILVGDHLDPSCAGNVVQHGNVVVSQNATDVELVVGDNSVLDGSMFVTDNTGAPDFTSGESVLGNQGGHTLACRDNASPFVGSPNPGWSHYSGQCSA